MIPVMTTPTQDTAAAYLQAELDILQHGKSSAIGDRTLTMADLAEVRAGRKEWEARARSEARPTGLPHSLATMLTR